MKIVCSPKGIVDKDRPRQGIMDIAAAGDPEAIKRYEAHLAKRREDYHKKKAEKEDIPA